MKINTYYFDDDAPTATKYADSIVIPAANFAVVEIPAPAEGNITRLTVKQTDGADVAFTVDLVDSVGVYTVGNHPNADLPTQDPDIYGVINQQTATAGNAVKYKAEHGLSFRNADVEHGSIQGRKLYLIIKPTGAVGETTWAAGITFLVDIG